MLLWQGWIKPAISIMGGNYKVYISEMYPVVRGYLINMKISVLVTSVLISQKHCYNVFENSNDFHHFNYTHFSLENTLLIHGWFYSIAAIYRTA